MLNPHFISSDLLIHYGGVFLILFALIGAFDGIYFHLIKFKLHLNPASRLEHLIHTLRAFLFVPIVYFLFATNSTGYYLLTGILFFGLDLVTEIFDILVEKKSRENLGGISGAEYVTHVSATAARMLAVTLILIAKEPMAFSLQKSVLTTQGYPVFLIVFAKLFVLGTFLGGVISLLSDRVRRPYRVRVREIVLLRSQAALLKPPRQSEVSAQPMGGYHRLELPSL
jgi:hypothetical protein